MKKNLTSDANKTAPFFRNLIANANSKLVRDQLAIKIC